MASLNWTLEPPRYGYEKDGQLYVPTHKELYAELFHRLNLFRSKKNWIQVVCWGASFALAIPLFVFLFNYLTLPLFIVAFLYSMVGLGTHGTIWYHRYSTHRAYHFKNKFWKFITRNLAVKIIPEEVYVISHHVHHLVSEKPGDPYNVNAGWLYCFLADANHQPIAKNLTETEYHRVCKMI